MLRASSGPEMVCCMIYLLHDLLHDHPTSHVPGNFTCTAPHQACTNCMPWSSGCLVSGAGADHCTLKTPSTFCAYPSSLLIAAGTIDLWQQCGGMGFLDGGVCGQPGYGPCIDGAWDWPACKPGTLCVRDTEWWWQCEPAPPPPPRPITGACAYAR